MEDSGEDSGKKSDGCRLSTILDHCSSSFIREITESVFTSDQDEVRTEIPKGIAIHTNSFKSTQTLLNS